MMVSWMRVGDFALRGIGRIEAIIGGDQRERAVGVAQAGGQRAVVVAGGEARLLARGRRAGVVGVERIAHAELEARPVWRLIQHQVVIAQGVRRAERGAHVGQVERATERIDRTAEILGRQVGLAAESSCPQLSSDRPTVAWRPNRRPLWADLPFRGVMPPSRVKIARRPSPGPRNRAGRNASRCSRPHGADAILVEAGRAHALIAQAHVEQAVQRDARVGGQRGSGGPPRWRRKRFSSSWCVYAYGSLAVKTINGRWADSRVRPTSSGPGRGPGAFRR